MSGWENYRGLELPCAPPVTEEGRQLSDDWDAAKFDCRRSIADLETISRQAEFKAWREKRHGAERLVEFQQ